MIEQEEKVTSPVTRRDLMRIMGLSAATVAAVSAQAYANPFSTLLATKASPTDGDILTFALNLEYLEAEFYAVASTGHSLSSRDIGGQGQSGRTNGGRKVSFKNPALADLAAEIAQDELEHVRFLRSALGDNAVAKPEINLDALRIGFANDNEFITLARAFEDVGVSAYRAAAKLIENKDYLDAAAGILATEAYHAGHLRSHAVYASVNGPKLDGKDQVPSQKNFVPTDKNGLVIGRSPDEVGKIVRGTSSDGGAFFPVGMNGNIR